MNAQQAAVHAMLAQQGVRIMTAVLEVKPRGNNMPKKSSPFGTARQLMWTSASPS